MRVLNSHWHFVSLQQFGVSIEKIFQFSYYVFGAIFRCPAVNKCHRLWVKCSTIVCGAAAITDESINLHRFHLCNTTTIQMWPIGELSDTFIHRMAKREEKPFKFIGFSSCGNVINLIMHGSASGLADISRGKRSIT